MAEKIGLSFTCKEGRIRIFRETLQVLDFAKHYRFLYNQKNKYLAIQACSFGDKGAHKMPDIIDGVSCVVYSTALVDMIYKDCHWDETVSYRASGSGFPDEKTAYVDLDSAEIVNEAND